MKKTILIFLLLYFSLTTIAQSDYAKKIIVKRASKDHSFKNGPYSRLHTYKHSPLSKEQKAVFEGLNYYKVNEEYKVEVEFIEFKNFAHATMTLTNGTNNHYWVIGKVKFKLQGQDCQLFVYEDKKFEKSQEPYRFIPFRDLTNGEVTFGGGRYIEWTNQIGKEKIIDFNNAFNPASVYNKSIYDPIVPHENTLNVRVEAGEKDF